MENEVNEPALTYHNTYTEAYLTMERTSQERHGLHRGRLITMAGASLNHHRPGSHLTGGMHLLLKGKACSVFPGDLRTKIPAKDSFTYPDITIAYGQPGLMDYHFDSLLNPSVIIEVLVP